MGIFSIFKRKQEQDGAGLLASDSVLRAGEQSRLPAGIEAERARQREIARATAAKIDAIETEMAFDIFNQPEPAWGSGARRPRATAQSAAQAGAPSTLPLMELATTALLADDQPAAPALAQTAPAIEEIAILYANGQAQVAGQMLVDSLATLGQTERAVWWMLFDLYQVEGRQDAFEDIAIDYASRFETSPPGWTPLPGPAAPDKPYAGVAPTEVFLGVLDARIAPQLARLQAAPSPVVRLEFPQVREVTPDGCACLLDGLRALRAGGRELIVAGAEQLASTVRATLVVGQRAAGEAPWLLLLELLQLMNREKEFEEAAMDYCVTFELSPPSFEQPANVATAAAAQAPSATDRFMLPALVEGNCGALLDAIDAYAGQYQPVVLDCSRLARVDYGAAAQLLARLRAIAAAGKRIELRDLNHLVTALFMLMGHVEVARLFPHKY